MLQTIVIGNVGAVPEVKGEQGREFITFRVCHNDRWKDEAGVEHTNSVWVDCVMNGVPKVKNYLMPGTTVCVMGSIQLRVYSSKKDRCMKAGMQVNVRQIELIGGRPDAVPSRLYDSNGLQHDVSKWYLTDCKSTPLLSMSGAQFITDANGWVSPVKAEPTQLQADNAADGAQTPATDGEFQGENAPTF